MLARSTRSTLDALQVESETENTRDLAKALPRLPCRLVLEIPATHFSVRDLLNLRPASLVETSFHQSSDLPLHVNGQLVGWTEFEVVGERLAVRLTDLS